MVLLYGVTMFLSAFLVFLIQPMTGNIFLPWVGGAPSVWNYCMFFFQLLLLAGYCYVHISSKTLKIRMQTMFHLAVAALAAVFLPIYFDGTADVPDMPAFWLLQQLFVLAAVPFFVVSATAPMLQRWFFHTTHRRASSPFFLYAASNAGSLSALTAYPLLIEPRLDLAAQASLWSGMYAMMILMMALCALFVKTEKQAPSDTGTDAIATHPDTGPPVRSADTGPGSMAAWITASFLPSALMLAATQYLTESLAPVPFLWSAPLALYLLTFIIAFSGFKNRIDSLPLILFLAFILIYSMGYELGFWPRIVAHLTVLFMIMLVCHQKLVSILPAARHLTSFYLAISIGGVAGGFFNSFIAPEFFINIKEYPFLMLLTVAYIRHNQGQDESAEEEPEHMPLRPGMMPLLAVLLLWAIFELDYLPGLYSALLNYVLVIILIMLAGRLNRLRGFDIPAFSLGVMIIMLFTMLDSQGGLEYRTRNFYGRKDVVYLEETGSRQLVQGTTVHGIQSFVPGWETVPLVYYHPAGPLGHIFKLPFTENEGFQAGVIGLGAGSMMSYSRAGQTFTFFEIDPDIVNIARNPQYFDFLDQGAGKFRIVTGDGRLRMLEEPDNSFDLIIIDAFSSGFIPKHLITVEAFEIYLDKMMPDGIIVMNISCRYLDITALMRAIADKMGLHIRYAADYFFDDQHPENFYRYPSEYVALSVSPKNLPPVSETRDNEHTLWMPMPATAHQIDVKPWTDSFSSLISIIRL